MPLKICKVCGRSMVADTSGGEIIFRCFCGEQEPGTPEDALVDGETLDAAAAPEMHERLIRNAGRYAINQQVKADCPECGLDYMSQIFVGENKVVITVCECGYRPSHRA